MTEWRVSVDILLIVPARIVGILNPLVARLATIIFINFVVFNLYRRALAPWLRLWWVLRKQPLVDEFALLRLTIFVKLSDLVRVVDYWFELLFWWVEGAFPCTLHLAFRRRYQIYQLILLLSSFPEILLFLFLLDEFGDCAQNILGVVFADKLVLHQRSVDLIWDLLKFFIMMLLHLALIKAFVPGIFIFGLLVICASLSLADGLVDLVVTYCLNLFLQIHFVVRWHFDRTLSIG